MYVHISLCFTRRKLVDIYFNSMERKIRYPSHRPKEIFSFLERESIIVQNKVFILQCYEHGKTRWLYEKNDQVARRKGKERKGKERKGKERKGNGAIYRIKKRGEEKKKWWRVASFLNLWNQRGSRLCRSSSDFRVMYQTVCIRERAFFLSVFSGGGSTLSARTWSTYVITFRYAITGW